MFKPKVKELVVAATTTVSFLLVNMQLVLAKTNNTPDSNGFTNPLANQTQTVGGIQSKLFGYSLDAVTAGVGGWVLITLIIIGAKWGNSAHHAQRREEVRTQLIFCLIGAVIAGGAGIISGAFFNFGTTL